MSDDVLGEIIAKQSNKLIFSRITKEEGWSAAFCRAIALHQSLGCPVQVQGFEPPLTWTPLAEVFTKDGHICIRSLREEHL